MSSAPGYPCLRAVLYYYHPLEIILKSIQHTSTGAISTLPLCSPLLIPPSYLSSVLHLIVDTLVILQILKLLQIMEMLIMIKMVTF